MRFHKIHFQTDAESFSFLSKCFIPKNNFFLAVVDIKTKKLCLLTQVSRRFCLESFFLFGYQNDRIDFWCAIGRSLAISSRDRWFKSDHLGSIEVNIAFKQLRLKVAQN